MRFNAPTVFVMGAPGTVAGPLRRRCMICQELHHMVPSTAEAITTMRERKLLFVVACYGCYQLMVKVNPQRGSMPPMGVNALNDRLDSSPFYQGR